MVVILQFSLFGCKIKIDFVFVLLLSFAALFNANDLLYMLLFSFLHEMGHLAALMAAGGKADAVILSYYGAALKYESRLSRNLETVVLLSGPLVKLILYLILKDDINLILFSLNILPIYPLDGGRIISLYLFKHSKAVGLVFLSMITFLGLYLAFFSKSFSLLLIAVYLIIYTINY